MNLFFWSCHQGSLSSFLSCNFSFQPTPFSYFSSSDHCCESTIQYAQKSLSCCFLGYWLCRHYNYDYTVQGTYYYLQDIRVISSLHSASSAPAHWLSMFEFVGSLSLDLVVRLWSNPWALRNFISRDMRPGRIELQFILSLQTTPNW